MIPKAGSHLVLNKQTNKQIVQKEETTKKERRLTEKKLGSRRPYATSSHLVKRSAKQNAFEKRDVYMNDHNIHTGCAKNYLQHN
jgi:hypothetical protein